MLKKSRMLRFITTPAVKPRFQEKLHSSPACGMSADKFDEEMPNLTPRSIIWLGTEVSANSAAEAVAARQDAAAKQDQGIGFWDVKN